MHLTDADATLIGTLVTALVTYLGNRRVKVRRAAREQTAAELEQVIESYKKKIAELSGDNASSDEGDDPA